MPTVSPANNPTSYQPGGANAGSTAGQGVDPGTAAAQIAIQQIGAPYISGHRGPYANGFDCSGLLEYCFLQGPGFDIGPTTLPQWNNTTVWGTVFDVNDSSVGPYGNQQVNIGGGYTLTGMTSNDLQDGDCLYYFADSNAGNAAHCMIYVGGGQCVHAPKSGETVQYINVITAQNSGNLLGDLSSSDPLRGVKRAFGSGQNVALGSGSGSGSGSAGQGKGTSGSSLASGYTASDVASLAKNLKNLKDPRSNLPFSSLFEGQMVPSIHPTNGGSLQVPAFGPASGTNTLYPDTKLVRGGMAELIAKEFKLYFMMNPNQIEVNAGINTSQLPPFQQSSDVWQSGGYAITNQTVSFTLIFNRMYEVWQGGFNNPKDGGPGPSAEGVRWDIRALERLMGIFDSNTTNGQGTGEGTNGWGMWPASMMPLQVVFGGPNTMRFQGYMASFDYTFTLFDANMIPIEAYADVSLMRIYNPQMSSPDIVGALWGQTQVTGPQAAPAQWNTGPFTQ